MTKPNIPSTFFVQPRNCTICGWWSCCIIASSFLNREIFSSYSELKSNFSATALPFQYAPFTKPNWPLPISYGSKEYVSSPICHASRSSSLSCMLVPSLISWSRRKAFFSVRVSVGPSEEEKNRRGRSLRWSDVPWRLHHWGSATPLWPMQRWGRANATMPWSMTPS